MKVTTNTNYNVETEEYEVRLYIDGKLQVNSTYYTTDVDDAIATSKDMIDRVSE